MQVPFFSQDPRHDVWGRTGQFSCKQNLSRLAVCDTDQKEITIDETYCWSTDHLGRPIDIYSDPDYRSAEESLILPDSGMTFVYISFQDAVHRLLEGEPQELPDHLRPARRIHQIQMLGNNISSLSLGVLFTLFTFRCINAPT